MARRIIIGEIVNLIKGLGGNPNKFMGTKSNINFLGKGPKEALFQGQIDIDALVNSGFPLERVIGEAETAGGYAVANKLNDLQLQRLKDNLLTLKKVYQPEQIPNVTDMATRTGDLTQEGLGSLRTTQMLEEQRPVMDKAMQMAGAESAAMRKAGLDPSKQADYFKWEDMKTKFQVHDQDVFKDLDLNKAGIATLTKRIQDRMAKIKNMSDELGAMGKGDVGKAGTYEFIDPAAEKVSYASKFNPKNEVHVEKAKALLEDPQIKGVYSEAEVKNAFDFEGLYQSHFDKGQVDIARLFEMEGGRNIPQMRSAARDALLLLMKKENQAGAGLRNFVDEIDFKYITEGGGGRAGDPINLMAKYFGKNVTQNLPKNPTKDNIDKFTDFIVNVRDSRGRGIDDPFFDRETIDFSKFAGYINEGAFPKFESGGRVDEGGLGEILQVPRTGFKYGSRTIAKGALAFLNKNKKNAEYMFKASDNVSPGYTKGDMKYNAELLADQLAEDAGVVYDDLDDLTRIKFYGTAYDYLSNQMANMLTHKRMLKDIGQQMQLSEFNVKGRLPNASGGLAKILEV